jgi:hypothetical protein
MRRFLNALNNPAVVIGVLVVVVAVNVFLYLGYRPPEDPTSTPPQKSAQPAPTPSPGQSATASATAGATSSPSP